MNNPAFPSFARCAALLAAAAGLLALPARAADDYENYIELAAGYTLQKGDRAGFQRDQQINKDGYGGIEDLLYYKYLNDETLLTLRAHALPGNNDYLFDVNITKDAAWYLKFGYKEYRVWFDGTGGYNPSNNFSRRLFDEDLALDRGNLWLEAGWIPEGKPNFIFRYDYLTRKGTKDSSSWGDTGIPLGTASTRGLLPSFYRIDEKRHQASATLSQAGESSKWELGARIDEGEYENRRNMTRRAGEAGLDRKITHKEGRDYDLFMVRGSYVTKVHEKLTLTTAVARSKIDSTISGTRIYGADYDPVYDPLFANRQARDEGFFDLHGETELRQTVGTLSAMYQPDEKWTVVPSVRFEKIEAVGVADMVETNFASNRSADNVEILNESDRSWENISESVAVRYRGIKDVSLNFTAEWVQAEGDLTESLTDEPGTPDEHVAIDRDTEFKRWSQKYAATANWYFRPGATLAVQYYFKGRENDYRNSRDSTVSTADRYPAYIANQDFETNDLNVRLSFRAAKNLRWVSRYDYQLSQINTQDIGLAMVETADLESHIFSQTLSYNPLSRWFIQGTVNYVREELTTPAIYATGAAAGRVTQSTANYWNYTLSTGYALDDNSDLYLDYNQYRAFDSYQNNSALSSAYGTQARTQQLGVTWFRRLSDRTALTARYAYAENNDPAYGTLQDYEAHLFYAKLQYRF